MIAFHVDAATLQFRGGAATADIWLEINGIPFPMERWNDFALVIMGWWCVSLLRLIRGERDKEVVDFMDGPYSVELQKLGCDRVRLRAVEGAGRTREISTDHVLLSEIGCDLVFQGRKLLGCCKDIGWWSPDAELLDEKLNKLSSEVVRLASRKI